MKLLFDQHLAVRLVDLLADCFPDSAHVRLLRLDRADDRTVWSRAIAGDFAIVTKDSDFNTLSMRLGRPPLVIWLRDGNGPAAAVASLLRQAAPSVARAAADSSIRIIELRSPQQPP